MARSPSMTYLAQAEELMRAKRKEEAKPEAKRQMYLTRADELLEAMGKEEKEPNLETKEPRRMPWPQILIACFCVLIIAAAAKGFLYLDTELGAVHSGVESAVKDINTLKAQVTASDARQQLAAVTAGIEDLKATNAELRAELLDMRETVETFKTKKSNAAAVQRNRR